MAGKDSVMLAERPQYISPTELDRKVFDALVPADHYLRRAAAVVEFERFRAVMAPCYSPDHGRPAIEPVLMLKLEFLQHHDRLSDRQVIEQAQVNVAYREFLGMSLESDLPDPSLLSYFRGRLGVERHRAIFDELLALAREHGLVKDRLRLKDATHVIADVAIPSTIQLVAATRQQLLDAAAPYDAERVEGERVRVETIRAANEQSSAEERLVARVTHLREIVAWVDMTVEQLSPTADAADPSWQRLTEALAVAHKALHDRERPQAGNRNEQGTGWIYHFRRATCAACPLRAKCLSKLPKFMGRSVTKNDYAAEYAAARAKAQTPEFAEVRRVHWKVERKLSEMVWRHGGRRAHCRGQPKVLSQQLMTAFAVNVKRMVRLLSAAQPPMALTAVSTET